MVKELKTSTESKAMLDDGVRRFSVGRQPNAQWIKIVAADPKVEGANWRVSHSGPSGDFANAIEKVVLELQKNTTYLQANHELRLGETSNGLLWSIH